MNQMWATTTKTKSWARWKLPMEINETSPQTINCSSPEDDAMMKSSLSLCWMWISFCIISLSAHRLFCKRQQVQHLTCRHELSRGKRPGRRWCSLKWCAATSLTLHIWCILSSWTTCSSQSLPAWHSPLSDQAMPIWKWREETVKVQMLQSKELRETVSTVVRICVHRVTGAKAFTLQNPNTKNWIILVYRGSHISVITSQMQNEQSASTDSSTPIR